MRSRMDSFKRWACFLRPCQRSVPVFGQCHLSAIERVAHQGHSLLEPEGSLSEPLLVDGGVGQDPLDILAGFVERNACDPAVGGQGLFSGQPAVHPVRPGVVGRGGQHRIPAELLVSPAEICDAETQIGFGFQNVVGNVDPGADLSGHLSGGGRHQLHQAEGASRGADVGHEGALLPDEAIDPGGVDTSLEGFTEDLFSIEQGEAQIQIIQMVGTAQRDDDAVVPAPGVGQFGGLQQVVTLQVGERQVPFPAGGNDASQSIELGGTLDGRDP